MRTEAAEKCRLILTSILLSRVLCCYRRLISTYGLRVVLENVEAVADTGTSDIWTEVKYESPADITKE